MTDLTPLTPMFIGIGLFFAFWGMGKMFGN